MVIDSFPIVVPTRAKKSRIFMCIFLRASRLVPWYVPLMSCDQILIHATALAYKRKGLLFMGPSGSGKSDLALRLMNRGGELIADDQVCLRVEGTELVAFSPQSIHGKCEVRSLGILTFRALDSHAIDFIIELKPLSEISRYPFDSNVKNLCDLTLPVYYLNAFEASVVEKISLIVEQ